MSRSETITELGSREAETTEIEVLLVSSIVQSWG